MTSFRNCIVEAADAGEIDKAVADAATEAYDAAHAAAAEALSPDEADRAAARATMKFLLEEDVRKQRLKALAIRSRRAALENLALFKDRRGYEDITLYVDGNGADKPPIDGWVQGGTPPPQGPYSKGATAAVYLEQLVDGDGGLAGAPGVSIKGRYQAIRGQLDAMMAELGEAFESDLGGFRNPARATLENLVREAFGEDTGDVAARQMAKAWAGTAEHVRMRFNAAGGDIGKIDDWGLPQTHDQLAVKDAGRAAWSKAVMPLLDRDRMIDRVTGQPFTDERLRFVLERLVWDSIATGGANKLKPGEHLGQGLLANRHQDERFLIFKDAGAWMQYQAQFGRADPYAAMMNHLDRMAREVAQMQVLGPNPAHQFDWLKRFALREAALEDARGADGAIAKSRAAVEQAERMYGTFTGELSTPYGRNALADVAGATRAYVSGAQLGTAVINDLASNPVFAAKTRAFTGLSKSGDFQAWAGHMFSEEARKTARRTGFILEGARAQLAGSTQDFLRAQTVGGKIAAGTNWFARRVPVAVYRLQGLTQNMAASRWAFQHEFMGRLWDLKDRTIADLLASANGEEREFGRTLEARGFTEAEWRTIASAEPDEPEGGARFLSPVAVSRVDDELGLRVSEMIERQTRLAVPEPSLWAQAQLVGRTRPGTIAGEINRSLTAYRSFTVTQTYLWSRELAARGLAADPTNWLGMAAAHATQLAVTLTIAAAATMQLRELIKGNQPRDMADAKFWGAALMTGGGLGIFGDFFYSLESRAGKSSAMAGLGAPAGAVSDVWNLTGGNIGDIAGGLAEGEDLGEAVADAKVGADAARFMGRYSPVSSLWWLRTAWDRVVVDQLQRALDPDAEEAFQRQRRRLQREFDQEQWWREGEALPGR